jgi:hypothetical protein
MNQGQMGQSMDPMMLDYLLEMGALTPEQEQLARQRQMVQGLRDSSSMENVRDTRNAGRAQVARSPLEMLAPAIGQGLAAYKDKGLDTQAAALKQKRLEGIKALRSRWAQPQDGLQELGGSPSYSGPSY